MHFARFLSTPFELYALNPILLFTSFLSNFNFSFELFFSTKCQSRTPYYILRFCPAKPKIKPYNQPPEPHTEHPKHPKPKAFGRRRLLKKHGLYCCRASFLTFGKFNCRGLREEEGVGAKFDLFSEEGRGFESKSVTDTRATTDKNDPFLNMGFKHWKKWVDKNGAKCDMGFGRFTQNTRASWADALHIIAERLPSGRSSVGRICTGHQSRVHW